MRKQHPSFIVPDEKTTIWRYMDFTKFVSLLERRALFFSSFSILRETDEHEGTYNTSTLEASRQKPFSVHDIGSDLLRTFGNFLAVNCWHMNEIESVAMWNVYLNGNPGVAIQSTFKNLDDSLNSDATKTRIDIGKVHYLAEDELIPEPSGFNALNAALWKWNSYQYENELRAVMISRIEEMYKYNGVYVPVDLHRLIQKIVVSPKAPKWFLELIVSISSKYELGDRVESSRLDKSPGNMDNNKLRIKWSCPKCQATKETSIEAFIIKEYSNNSTTVFTADKVTVRCQDCEANVVIRLPIDLTDENQTSPESA